MVLNTLVDLEIAHGQTQDIDVSHGISDTLENHLTPRTGLGPRPQHTARFIKRRRIGRPHIALDRKHRRVPDHRQIGDSHHVADQVCQSALVICSCRRRPSCPLRAAEGAAKFPRPIHHWLCEGVELEVLGPSLVLQRLQRDRDAVLEMPIRQAPAQ